jgi:hypothetical protein
VYTSFDLDDAFRLIGVNLWESMKNLKVKDEKYKIEFTYENDDGSCRLSIELF